MSNRLLPSLPLQLEDNMSQSESIQTKTSCSSTPSLISTRSSSLEERCHQKQDNFYCCFLPSLRGKEDKEQGRFLVQQQQTPKSWPGTKDLLGKVKKSINTDFCSFTNDHLFDFKYNKQTFMDSSSLKDEVMSWTDVATEAMNKSCCGSPDLIVAYSSRYKEVNMSGNQTDQCTHTPLLPVPPLSEKEREQPGRFFWLKAPVGKLLQEVVKLGKIEFCEFRRHNKRSEIASSLEAGFFRDTDLVAYYVNTTRENVVELRIWLHSA